MHAVTFAAFQDELRKIAAQAASIFQPIPVRKPAGMHLHTVGGDGPSMASPNRGAETVAGRGQARVAPPVQDATGVLHSAPSGMTQTHVRPASVVGHTPSTVPHPTAVPGGGAGLLRRGASLARAHAAPLAVGAGVATMGAMALSKMRQKNAPSR